MFTAKSVVFGVLAAASLAASASPLAVRRLTTDGRPKYGTTLCGNGSTVAWLEVLRDASASPDDIVVVRAAATDGSWNRELFRYSNGAFLAPLKGPHYDAADRNYRLNLRTQKILLSHDGRRVLLVLDEFAQSRHHDFFLAMDLPAATARLHAPVLPPGMGKITGHTNYNSAGVWLTNALLENALSDDGRVVFFNVTAFGTLGGNGKTLDALVAMDLDTGKAVRVAGYQAMDANAALTPGDPEYAHTRLSAGGDLVAFALAKGYWVGDAKGSPLRRVAQGDSDMPLLAGQGRFVVDSRTGVFVAVEGGAQSKTAPPPRGVLDFPFWDGQAGFLLHPLLAAGEEIVQVRGAARTVLVRAGEAGLPAGWKFGVAAVSSDYTYQLASTDGARMVLSLMSADGKNDLFFAGQAGAPAAISAAPVTAPVPAAPPVAAATDRVGQAGGELQVTAADSPIRGFRIQVPPGAYRENVAFRISTVPAPKLRLPAGAEAVTPLIRVENGGAFASLPLTLTIPVKAVADSAVLAFYVDESTGKLEGMPLVRVAADSLTVLASHFSSFLVVRMPERLLPASVDSGFRPGVDDWQMVNEGSFATPGGHCTGQSITAMWYYFEKALRGEPRLFSRYDNNGVKDAPTPGFWLDDSFPVRLVATVWRDLQWDDDRRTASLQLSDMHADRTILNAFRLSMHVTGEPQLTEVFRYDAKSQKWSGHALVVYKVENGRLLVADPNFPGKSDRSIDFDEAAGRFKPYSSGETKSSQGVAYTNICYVAKTALIPWADLGKRWKEYQASFPAKPQENSGIIGQEYFPAYKLYIAEPAGRTELVDYFVTGRERMKVLVEGPGTQLRVTPVTGTAQLAVDANGEFALQPGYNDIGFYVQGATQGYWRWLDFRRFRIYRGSLTIDPPTLDGRPATSYTFTAKAGAGAVAGEAFEWRFGDGSAPVSSAGPAVQHRFERPGRYTIALKAMDRQGRPVGEARAEVTIAAAQTTAPPAAPAPAALSWLSELKSIELIFRVDYVCSDGTRAEGYEFHVPSESDNAYGLTIQWNGASFTGSWERLPQRDSPGTTRMTVSGTIRPDGHSYLLDFEGRILGTRPDAPKPPPYGGSSIQELRIKGIPMITLGRSSSRILIAKNLEGDAVRDLAPALVVSYTTRGATTSLQSMEWRWAKLKVEFKRGVFR